MRIFKKLLLVIITILAVVGGGMALGAYLLKDRIVPYAIKHLNSNLETPLTVGKASLSFFADFPNVAVVMSDIKLGEDTVSAIYLNVKDLYVSFSLQGILSNTYKVSNISINNGYIGIKRGNGDFNIVKSNMTPNQSDNPAYSLKLPRVSIKDVEIELDDEVNGWKIKLLSSKTQLRALLKGHKSSLKLDFEGRAIKVEQGNFIFLNDEQVNASFFLNLDSEKFIIQNGMFEVGRSMLLVNVNYGVKEELPIAIDLSARKIDARTLINILAQQNISLPENFRAKGDINFSLKLNGTNSQRQSFDANMAFNAEKLELSYGNRPRVFIDNLEGVFRNANIQQPELSETHLTFKRLRTGNSELKGVVKFRNTLSPKVYSNLNLSIVLSDINAWAPQTPIVAGWVKGQVELLGNLTGSSEVKRTDLGAFKAKGLVDFGGVSYSFSDRPLKIDNIKGTAELTGKGINLKSVTGKCNGSGFSSSIEAVDIFNTLAYNRTLRISATVQADYLNTEWLTSTPTTETTDASQSTMPFELSVSIKIDKFKHEGFECSDLTTRAFINDRAYEFKSISGGTMGGNFDGRLAVENLLDGNRRVLGELRVEKIDIQNLFASFNNFGQQEVRSDNIKGELTGAATFVIPYTNGSVDTKHLSAIFDLRVSSGKLEGLKQLEALSRFFSLEELNNISFKSLQNSISIQNGVIIIPQMEVKSSLVDFTCTGKHDMDGPYSYRLKLNLTDVLFKKTKRANSSNTEFGTIASDGTGRTPLFVKIEGTSQGQRVSFDTEAAKQSTREAIRTERESLVKALRQEFGGVFNRKADSTQLGSSGFKLDQDETLKEEKKRTDQKKDKKESEQKTKFTIEWE